MPDDELADDRYADVDRLLDGLTVTHRITEHERSADEVAVDPDLIVAHFLAEDGRHIPIAGGGVLTFTAEDTFAGPDGWLPEEPVLALTLRDGAVEVAGLDEPPPLDVSVAERLGDVYESAVDEARLLEVPELLLEARALHPKLLGEPQAPLADLLPAAGIELEQGRLPHSGDGVDDTEELIRHLSEDHGFREETVADVLQVWNAALRFSSIVLREVADAVEGTGPPDVDDTVLDELGGPVAEEAAGALGRLLEDQSGATAVLHDVVGTDPLLATGVLALLERGAAEVDGRHARANRHWLRARMLEFIVEDHAEAERELGRALDTDPGHGEAALDRARYLADRGEAGAALGLLRQLDRGGDARLTEVVEIYAQPGPADARRNDPCPCESGRKHKVCCGPHNGWPLDQRRGWLWDKVWRNATMPHGFGPIEDVTAAVGRPPRVDQLDDPVLANLVVFEAGAIEEFAATRGALLPADELDLLHEFAAVRAGVYEVVAAEEGESVEVRDLRTREHTRLSGRMLDGEVKQGEILLLWIIPGPDGPEVVDGGVLVPEHTVEGLLDALDTEDAGAGPLGRWYVRLLAEEPPVAD